MTDNVEHVIEEILKSNTIASESTKEAMALFRVYMAIDDASRRSTEPPAFQVSILRGIILFRLEQIHNEMEAASPYMRKRKLCEDHALK